MNEYTDEELRAAVERCFEQLAGDLSPRQRELVQRRASRLMDEQARRRMLDAAWAQATAVREYNAPEPVEYGPTFTVTPLVDADGVEQPWATSYRVER